MKWNRRKILREIAYGWLALMAAQAFAFVIIGVAKWQNDLVVMSGEDKAVLFVSVGYLATAAAGLYLGHSEPKES